MRVSIITNLAVKRDATSNIARQQLDVVESYCRGRGEPFEAKLYAQECDIADPRIHVVGSPEGLLADEHFHLSDVIVHHFLTYHTLFDAIHFAPRTARVVATYHGITPPNLLPEQDRPLAYRSYQQAVNLAVADRVLTGSSHLHRELIGMGVPEHKLGVVPYTVPLPVKGPEFHEHEGSTTRLLYVGRYSPAKGLRELLHAAGRLREQGSDFELRLVGTRRFAAPEFLNELERLGRKMGLGGKLRMEFDVPGKELEEHYRWADALVLPSYHEGFCVPVIEAMMFGCFPITTDAGALPETTGGLGHQCRAGDERALAEVITRFVGERESGTVKTTSAGELTREQWRERVSVHLEQFSSGNFEEGLREALFAGLEVLDINAKPLVAASRQRAFAGLRDGPADPPEPNFSHEEIARALEASDPVQRNAG